MSPFELVKCNCLHIYTVCEYFWASMVGAKEQKVTRPLSNTTLKCVATSNRGKDLVEDESESEVFLLIKNPKSPKNFVHMSTRTD